MSSIITVRTAKAGYLVLAALFCIMGIAMLALPDITLDMIGWGVGAIVAAFGIVRVMGHYSRDPYGLAFQHDPVLGGLAIALGSVLMFRRSVAVNVLGMVLGIELLADNLFKVQTAMEARRFGLDTWWLMLALAVVAAFAGILLIACPFEGMRAWVRVMGISLLSQGVMSFCVGLCAIHIPPQRTPDISA